MAPMSAPESTNFHEGGGRAQSVSYRRWATSSSCLERAFFRKIIWFARLPPTYRVFSQDPSAGWASELAGTNVTPRSKVYPLAFWHKKRGKTTSTARRRDRRLPEFPVRPRTRQGQVGRDALWEARAVPRTVDGRSGARKRLTGRARLRSETLGRLQCKSASSTSSFGTTTSDAAVD
jgi:hypothetical protein